MYYSELSEDETMLCATNGETYRSLCRLLQDSKREGVAYVGGCGSEECSGGEVRWFPGHMII